MEFIDRIFKDAFSQTIASIAHNWPFLAASIAVAAFTKVFADAGKVTALLRRFRGAGVLAATGAAVATPFCSCGTTAVILGMMAGAMPLAPIVAFMVASPLSSPETLVYGAGLFGWPFAIFHFAASIVLGLAGGGIAAALEKRGLLAGQARLAAVAEPEAAATGPAAGPSEAAGGCSCGSPEKAAAPAPVGQTWRILAAALDIAKKIVPMFVGFAFIGYALNGLIPDSVIRALFGRGHAYSVPLAASIGLPLYLSSEASLPLVRALLDSGMSQGAIMAFLIAGSGTSIGAITGALTIARWRVVGLVVAVLWVGAILAGYGFDLFVAAGLA